MSQVRLHMKFMTAAISGLLDPFKPCSLKNGLCGAPNSEKVITSYYTERVLIDLQQRKISGEREKERKVGANACL